MLKEKFHDLAAKFANALKSGGLTKEQPHVEDDDTFDGWWSRAAIWGVRRPRIGIWYDRDQRRDFGLWFGLYGPPKKINETSFNFGFLFADQSERKWSLRKLRETKKEMASGKVFLVRERYRSVVDSCEYLGIYQASLGKLDKDEIVSRAAEKILEMVNLVDGVAPELRLSKTQRTQVIQARVGQDKFRKALEKGWGKCAVTGCVTPELLRASHIVPWSVDEEARTDARNGLLLLASLDVLFDKHFISFEDNGKIVISKCLSLREREIFGVHEDMHLIKPDLVDKRYLRMHRDQLRK